jgi:lipid-binding SYLF domain-containing protein
MFEHHWRRFFGERKVNSMSMQRSLVLAAFLTLTLATAAHAQHSADQRRAEIDTNAKTTLDQLFKVQPDSKGLYEKSAGYAVFVATKAGFIVSGGSGTGVAVNKSSGQKTYMRMGMGGIGLGIGAQRYSVVAMFENEAHLNKFVTGGWDSSATAEAAAGKEGVAVRSSFIDGVAFFQMTDKGLMAHADVTGTRFWVIDDLK